MTLGPALSMPDWRNWQRIKLTSWGLEVRVLCWVPTREGRKVKHVAEKKAKGTTNRGQAKEHDVLDNEGNPLVMTQAEWRARDKSAGHTRPDEDEEVVEEEEAPVVDSETTPS